MCIRDIDLCDPDVLYIGRGGRHGLRASMWHNPHRVEKEGRERAVSLYVDRIRGDPRLKKSLPELAGRRIACWCKMGDECHGDILVRTYLEERSDAP